MRTPISRFERATGLFLSVVFALLVIGVLATGYRVDLLDAFSEGFVLFAVADEGHGAVVGSPVKVRGVEMGTVTKLELRDDARFPGRPVRMTIRIRASAAHFLSPRTRAIIVEPPLGSGMPPFGTAAIELRSEGDGFLKKYATVEAEGELSMVGTMAKMSQDVSAMRDRMLHSIDEMGSTFTNMRKLTESMADGKGIAGRMLTDPALARDLEAMLHDARAATGDMRKLMTDMNRVTGQVPAVLNDAHAISQDGQRLMAKVDGALASLPRLVASTERTLAATEELLASLKKTAGYAPELVRKVDVSLEETNRLVEAAQKNFVLRSTLPDRQPVRSEAETRPPAVLPPPAKP